MTNGRRKSGIPGSEEGPFFNKLSQVSNLFFSKIKNFSNYFLESACSFYLGFILGNLFGTFLTFFRNQIFWDGFLLMTILLLFEFLNFIIYKKKDLPAASQDWSVPKKTGLRGEDPPPIVLRPRGPKPSSKFQKLFIILKNLQIGILFGLFIDAFKVGS